MAQHHTQTALMFAESVDAFSNMCEVYDTNFSSSDSIKP